SKTVVGATSPWVQIPPPPHCCSFRVWVPHRGPNLEGSKRCAANRSATRDTPNSQISAILADVEKAERRHIRAGVGMAAGQVLNRRGFSRVRFTAAAVAAALAAGTITLLGTPRAVAGTDPGRSDLILVPDSILPGYEPGLNVARAISDDGRYALFESPI